MKRTQKAIYEELDKVISELKEEKAEKDKNTKKLKENYNKAS